MIIDDEDLKRNGELQRYRLKKGKLERIESLFINTDDICLVSSFSNYESIIMDNESLIARGKIIYLFDSKDKVDRKGVLESEDLI